MLKTSMKVLPLLVLGAVSGQACASGFQLMEQNASGMGNAYAGSAASAENASVQFFNAAGLTELQGKQVSAGLNYIELDTKFHDRGSVAPFGLPNTVKDGAQGGDAAFVPNFYYSMPLSKDLYFGFGANAPFGMRTDWSKNWVGQSFGTLTDVKAMNLNANLAYRVNDQWSVGGGVSYQKFDAQIESRINLGAGPTRVGNYSVAGNDWSWGYNLGLLFKPSTTTQFGVSYRSAVKHELEGKYTISGLSGPFLAGALAAGHFSAASGDAKVNIKLPDTWIFSAAHQLNNRWELLGDVSRTGWSSIPELRVSASNGSRDQVTNYQWRDTWRVAVGANYQASDAWKLRVGLAFDQSPVKEAMRTPRLPDQDRVWYSIGAQYKINASNKLDVGYSYVKAKNADAHLAGTATQGTLNGEYKSSVQMVGVQYSVSF